MKCLRSEPEARVVADESTEWLREEFHNRYVLSSNPAGY